VERLIADRSRLATELASAFFASAERAVRGHGSFRVALTGGSTASLYEALTARAHDWSAVHFFFGDERAVPPDHADSNFALAQRTLLTRAAVPSANVHRMRADEADLERAASDYEALLGAVPLDVVLLGVGPDGHVASLFPGHALLGEGSRRVASLTDSPKPPPTRLTLTLRAIREARAVWLFAMGAEKAPVVRRAIIERDRALPCVLASEGVVDVRWFLDDAAASALV